MKSQNTKHRTQTNYKSQITNIQKILPGVKKNVLLKNYTTFRIGGPVKYFYTAKNKSDLIKAVKAAKELNLPFFILGGGSNLLVADEGYKGIVIKSQITNYKTQTNYKKQNTKVYIGAGMPLSLLVSKTVEKGLTGLEWAVGIPGITIGGAIRGNAGAFGQSMKDITKTVTVLKIPNQSTQISLSARPNTKPKVLCSGPKFQTKIFRNKDCKFKYRDSIFKHDKNLIILSAEIELRKGDKKEIKKRMIENLKWREDNQPLDFPSAGSIFQNPKEHPAGWLIEKCGLKGKRIGKAQISKKHANFIVNLGDAKSQDVIKLIDLTKRKVKEKFGIKLNEEIVILSVSEKQQPSTQLIKLSARSSLRSDLSTLTNFFKMKK